MRFFLKVFIVVAASTLVFLTGIIIWGIFGIRPAQVKTKSEIKSIGVYLLPTTDISFPKDITKLSDSSFPLVFVLHLQIDDSTINSSQKISSGFVIQNTYAVDPGRVMEYCYTSKISGLRILSFFKNDTTDITREFTLRSKDTFDKPLECNSIGIGAKMMEKISDGRVRTENFLLQHHNQHLAKFDNLKFELILEKGIVLEAIYSPINEEKALAERK